MRTPKITRLIPYPALLLLILALVYPAMAQPQQDVQTRSYSIPVIPDTQSGAVFVDNGGHAFAVVRDDGHLKVYRDGVIVLERTEAYGAPVGYVGPDGMLYVSSLDGGDRRKYWLYQVPEWQGWNFISGAAHVPMVQR